MGSNKENIKKLLAKVEILEGDIKALVQDSVLPGKQNLISNIWRNLGFLKGALMGMEAMNNGEG